MNQGYMPPQNYLLENFTYNTETGEFTNNKRKCKQKPSNNYRTVKIWNTGYPAHRIIWLYMTGEYPIIVDHINGHKADNRWINLHNSNIFEHTCKHIDQIGKCEHPGIYESKDGWKAFIKANYETIALGTFNSLLEAIQAQENHPREMAPRIRVEPKIVVNAIYIDPELLNKELESIEEYNLEIAAHFHT